LGCKHQRTRGFVGTADSTEKIELPGDADADVEQAGRIGALGSVDEACITRVQAAPRHLEIHLWVQISLADAVLRPRLFDALDRDLQIAILFERDRDQRSKLFVLEQLPPGNVAIDVRRRLRQLGGVTTGGCS
jgi:hypothetical protein